MSETERDSNVARPLKAWILYDGGCGFCFRWVHFWER
jgi:predicted DCC family thiol-disulfide oxidoreductase YuxK